MTRVHRQRHHRLHSMLYERRQRLNVMEVGEEPRWVVGIDQLPFLRGLFEVAKRSVSEMKSEYSLATTNRTAKQRQEQANLSTSNSALACFL